MPNDTPTTPPKPPRSPATYRLVLAIPLLTLMYLIASGRFAAYWHLFVVAQRTGVDERAFNDAFVTAILWSVSATPLALASWELGRRNVMARRTGFELFSGLKDVFKIAFRGAPAWDSVNRAQAIDQLPRDRRAFALFVGGVFAIGLPVFFTSFAPPLRTPSALIWLIGAGVLMGGMAYCQQRAAAYLRDEPRRFDLLRQWRALNPNRYDEPGRVFVRWQRALSIAMPIWWLVVGAAVLFR